MSKKWLNWVSATIILGMSTNLFGAEIQVSHRNHHVDSIIQDNRSYVALRQASGLINEEVNYDKDTGVISVGDHIEMQKDSTTYSVNGVSYVGDVAPLINNGTTYIPLRLLCELLGYNVTFSENIVGITIGETPYTERVNEELSKRDKQPLNSQACRYIFRELEMWSSQLDAVNNDIDKAVVELLDVLAEVEKGNRPVSKDTIQVLNDIQLIFDERECVSGLTDAVYDIYDYITYDPTSSEERNNVTKQELINSLVRGSSANKQAIQHADDTISANMDKYHSKAKEQLALEKENLSEADRQVLENLYALLSECTPFMYKNEEKLNRQEMQILQQKLLESLDCQTVSDMVPNETLPKQELRMVNSVWDIERHYADMAMGIITAIEGLRLDDMDMHEKGLRQASFAYVKCNEVFAPYLEKEL